jgi:acyl-CoA thioesterase I
MATDSADSIARLTSRTMVSVPSGLLTLRQRSSVLSTISRVIGILLGFWICVASGAAPAPTILVFGDSLSASYGLEPNTGWVSLLEKRLREQGYSFRVTNASVSGETTEGGLARLPRALQIHKPSIVVLELGANDGLRALPVANARKNLEAMVKLSKAAGSKVLLLGVRLPPNYGQRYNSDFEKMFADLGRVHKVAVVPWFMKNVADQPTRMQRDGLHPNLQGQAPLLENVWPALKPLLGKGS